MDQGVRCRSLQTDVRLDVLRRQSMLSWKTGLEVLTLAAELVEFASRIPRRKFFDPVYTLVSEIVSLSVSADLLPPEHDHLITLP